MRTLAVLSRKGGTGKTTVAVHMAVAAQAAGYKTIVADIDPQASACAWYAERRKHTQTPEVTSVTTGGLFTHRLAASRQGYDLMVIDTRPSTDMECIEAIRWADACLVVVRPAYFDLTAIVRTVELVTKMNKKAMFVINQAPSRRGGDEPKVILDTYQTLIELGLPVAPIGLRYRAAFQNAVRYGKTVTEYDPDSLAAFEIDGMWDWLTGELWPSQVPQPVLGREDGDLFMVS